jgi:predicted lactoylglutathione lyase
MPSIYINLPVADLAASTAFYQALGFVKNDQLSNDKGTALAFDGLYVMLLTHDFYKGFLPAHKTIADAHTTSAVLNAMECVSKEQVDAIYDKAIAAGGKATIPTQDHGFMYGRDFEDLDGHIWEMFWMDVSQIPQA